MACVSIGLVCRYLAIHYVSRFDDCALMLDFRENEIRSVEEMKKQIVSLVAELVCGKR